MFISLKANKKRIIAFLVLVCIIVGACILLKDRESETEIKPQEFFGETNEQRIAFLSSFGWEVEPKAIETREVMIPEEFNDVYTAYNEMQKAQGFDLKAYAGQKCMQYKYIITNYPDQREVYATLLVYDNLILGGDLACAEVDGFMHGFAADSVHYGEKAVEKANEEKQNAYKTESAEESKEAADDVSTAEEASQADAQDAEVSVDEAPVDGENANAEAVPEDTQDAAAEITPDEDAYPTD